MPKIDPINGIIEVNQLFSYTNNSNKLIDTLYLYDWNHSYSDTSTPLAVKLAEEFNFKFEKSQSDEKGYTKVDNFRSNLGSLKWHRLEEQKDIVAIHLVNPIQPQDSFQFTALYSIKLPANHFTGYGINNLDEISFRNGFLEFANQSFNGQWNLDSNYGFNDRTASRSSASFSVCFPENYTIIPSIKGSFQNNCWQAEDQNQSNLVFYLKLNHNFKTIGSPNFEIQTDMADDLDTETGLEITNRIQEICTKFFWKPKQSILFN